MLVYYILCALKKNDINGIIIQLIVYGRIKVQREHEDCSINFIAEEMNVNRNECSLKSFSRPSVFLMPEKEREKSGISQKVDVSIIFYFPVKI